MYRQGLGDCFLLAARSEQDQTTKYILIDCGVHAREDDGPARLAQVMNNVVAATGSKLDVVVATHEHADHLSGFVQKNSPFLKDGLRVVDLWLAWTEKRGDRQADRLRKQHGTMQRIIDKAVKEAKNRAAAIGTSLTARLDAIMDFEESNSDVAALDAALERIKTLRKASPDVEGSSNLNGILLGAAKGKPGSKRPSSNEIALGLLLSKVGNNVTYGEPGDLLPVPGVSNLRAYVLGPPRNEDLLSKDKPSKIRGATEDTPGGAYKEVYLTANTSSRAFALSPALGAEPDDDDPPVPDDWRRPFARAFWREFTMNEAGGIKWSADTPPPDETKKLVDGAYLDPDTSWRRIDGDWLGAAESLAMNLVGDTNNTSLVLAFEWGKPGSGVTLLFPGDAQVGNWLSWRDQSYGTTKKKFSADDLLSRIILYKVGHHGSHNATARRDPRDPSGQDPLGVPFGLELMNDIIAMIPVDFAAAQKNMPDPWKMPHEPLYRRLRDKARRRVLRCDLKLNPLDERSEEKDLWPTKDSWQPVPGLKGVRWRQSKDTFKVGTDGPLFYDVAISIRE